MHSAVRIKTIAYKRLSLISSNQCFDTIENELIRYSSNALILTRAVGRNETHMIDRNNIDIRDQQQSALKRYLKCIVCIDTISAERKQAAVYGRFK